MRKAQAVLMLVPLAERYRQRFGLCLSCFPFPFLLTKQPPRFYFPPTLSKQDYNSVGNSFPLQDAVVLGAKTLSMIPLAHALVYLQGQNSVSAVSHCLGDQDPVSGWGSVS